MRPRLHSVLFSLMVLVAAAQAPPQEPAPRAQPAASDLRAAADAEFGKRDYEAAAVSYSKLAEQGEDLHVYYRLGYCLHALGRLDEALVWHQKAAGLWQQDKRQGATATYNVACVHALKGDKQQAIAALQLAVERGFAQGEHMQRDPDLESIRGEPEFKQLLAKLEGRTRLVAVVVHDGVELLDFAGPAEVFGAARGADGQRMRVALVAPKKAPVHANRVAAAITPEFGIDDCPQPAILVIPGGDTERLQRDQEFMAWFARTAPKCEVVLSVCTGAFVLAQAGLLDGKPATTHHGSLQALQREFPAVQVQEGRKWIDSGHCVTAAGVSSGIEGALYVVQRLAGADAATQVARYIEYDAWPPAAPAAK